MSEKPEEEVETRNFIENIIDGDLETKKHSKIITRFPPEPNGYLHIGHAKSICLNFGLAKQFEGVCHLRFDDTNPEKEDTEYVESIREDVRWLGWEWGENNFFASDYFDHLYDFAVQLIELGKAFVCDLDADQVKAYRGNLKEPGKESPFRNRSVEENLDLFEGMKKGLFEEGSKVLRAKIDMASPNMNMRDPALYRIRKVNHHRTGNKWCIYPMYDFTHCLSDMLEGITHSVCTLEFEDHRPLYDWVLESLETPCHPQQIEFARLNLTHTVMSKRKLLKLVEEGHVQGWDDPRMPTISGLRRRGYPAAAIREFCDRIGIAKRNNVIEFSLLEFCARSILNKTSNRVMGVVNPLKVVITNYPEDLVEEMDGVNNPEDDSAGGRKIPFSREIYIEKEDFMEEAPKKFFRLAPGREVRLRYAYYITCQDVVKDPKTGEILELHCTYDPETRGGGSPDGRKVKGTLHWVSASKGVWAKANLYDNLFTQESPEEAGDFIEVLNSESLKEIDCIVEPYLKESLAGDRIQFERIGYFCLDKDSKPEELLFNRTVTLRDSWAKTKKK